MDCLADHRKALLSREEMEELLVSDAILLRDRMNSPDSDGATLERNEVGQWGINLVPFPWGLPDCGPKWNRHCYSCDEPIGENLECCLIYDDPLASILGKCDICNAPRYEILGECPACGGPVYDLDSHFACYNTISDSCDFRISVDRMDELDLHPCEITIINLLAGGLTIIEVNDKGRDERITFAEIVRCVDGGWDVVKKELGKK